jgi:Kef-type K+ transport system membrane component KefB
MDEPTGSFPLHGRALQVVQTVLTGAWTITPFTLFLVELIIIVTIARILTYLLKFVGQPGVVAEILAGIVIGPTVLGRVPGFSANVFPPKAVSTLGVIANICLVFFLFNVGIELDAGELKENLKMSLFIPIFGMGIPLIAGTVVQV